MPKRNPHLTDEQRLEIFQAFVAGGATIRKMSDQFQVTERTIRRICRAGKVSRKQYDNSKRFHLSEQDKIDIISQIKADSCVRLNEIANRLSTRVSIRTIGRFLERAGFSCHQLLSEEAKLDYADDSRKQLFERTQAEWNEEQWKQTVFTDECVFSLNVVNYSKQCKRELTVNVFGLINWYWSAIYPVSNKFEADDLNDLLCDGGVLDSLKRNIPEPINFLPSTCKLYMVRTIRDLLVSRGFSLVENYAAVSPNVNPVESLWKVLNEKVTTAIAREDPENEEDLFALIKR